MANSVNDKARKARERAREENYAKGSSYKTDELVMNLTRGKAKGLDKVMGRYADTAESRAANVMQQRRRTDAMKTASRATAIANRTEKKMAEKTIRAGVSGTPKKKGVSAGVRAAAKKAAAGMKKPVKKKAK
jgi:hypothetical protein